MYRLLASLATAAALGVLAVPAVHAQSTPASAAPRSQRAQEKPAVPVVPARTDTVVNLNTATVADLEKLPGIGAKVAARIIEYRQKRGPFKKVEELMNVQGIGEKSFLKLRSQLTVASAPETAATRQQN
jgi:comEA protein